MNQDSRTLLSLVAAGRITSAEAERWLAASREERNESHEDRWIVTALVLVTLVQFGPALTQFLTPLRHLLSLITGQL
jgi:hypothetical protein